MPTGEPASQKLLDVVTDLLARDGYEGVSVRKVASAAGLSIGAVQHHFPTKDAMLDAAMEHASRRFRAHLEKLVDREATAEHALRTLMRELLGLDPDVRPASVLWLQRAARAAIDPAVAQRHAAEWQDLEDLVTLLLQGARPDRSRRWCTERAGLLLALTDGLAVAALVEPGRVPPDRARRLLEAATDDVLASGDVRTTTTP